jgi:hypothetical protein
MHNLCRLHAAALQHHFGLPVAWPSHIFLGMQPQHAMLPVFIGAARGTRTPDPVITNNRLCITPIVIARVKISCGLQLDIDRLEIALHTIIGHGNITVERAKAVARKALGELSAIES